MVVSSAAAVGSSLTVSYEKLFLSSLRLSSAATLFGMHQVERVVNDWQQEGGIGRQLDRIGDTVDSLTRCLAEEISPGKKEALDSLSDITVNVVRQSVEGMRLLNPFEAVRFATGLAQRSTAAAVGWTRKPPLDEEEPQLAAEVLAG